MDKILIYCDKKNSRISYIFKYVFIEHIGLVPLFTTSRSDFSASTLPKINYSSFQISEEIWFKPISLLSEENISPQHIEIHHKESLPYFFETLSSIPSIPFDLFSLCFFLITRYEEYLPNQSVDKHLRFESKVSIAQQYRFLKTPIVDIWLLKFKDYLQRRYPQYSYKESTYSFKPTFDVDLPWKYLHKSWIRTIGGFTRNLLKIQIQSLFERVNVHFRCKKDPYFSFFYIKSVFKSIAEPTYFFFPTATTSTFDKNPSPNSTPYQKLIRDIFEQFEIGLHPTYYSLEQPNLIKKEKKQLENIVEQPIKTCRFHYLRFRLPESYQALLAVGIENDFSMGYPDAIGFRASTSLPFNWFDLSSNEESALRIHPFSVMDVTLKNYMEYTPDEAIKICKDIIVSLQQYGGAFSFIWHNNSFDEKEWPGWKKAFEKIVSLASKKPSKN